MLPRRAPGVTFDEIALGADPREVAEREGADGWLRIGDPALREVLAADAPPTFNPSAAWSEDTGLPFVFAVWIVAPGVTLTDAQIEAFLAARTRGAAGIEDLVREASRRWSLPLDACRTYLAEECRYDPGDDLGPALAAFRDAAAPLGLCRAELDPTPIAVQARGDQPCPG